MLRDFQTGSGLGASSEVGDTATSLKCYVKPSVFVPDVIQFEAPVGSSLAEILERSGAPVIEAQTATAWINRAKVEHRHFHVVRPKPGMAVEIVIGPRDQRTALLVAGSIGIAIAAGLAGPAAAGWAVGAGYAAEGGLAAGIIGASATAGVALVGSIALNALLPPPDAGGSDSEESYERSTIGSTANQVTRYDPIPEVLGQIKVTPRMLGLPYSELEGGQEWTRFLFAPSIGETNLTDLKMGDTDIDQLNDVEYEIIDGSGTDQPTLYSRDIYEDVLNIKLTKADGPSYTRTTQPNCRQIILRFHAPRGPYWTDSDGNFHYYEIDFDIDYRPAAGGSWVPIEADIGFGNDGPSPKFWTVKQTTDPDQDDGRYEVRVTRRTGDNDNIIKRNDEIYWRVLQTKQKDSGTFVPDNCSAVAVYIKAQGSLGAFTCLAQSKARVRSGGSWTYDWTSNPASLVLRVLQGPGGGHFSVADSKIDLDSFATWWDHCNSEGLEFNGVLEDRQPVAQRIQMIASRGHATIDLDVDGRYTVIMDDPAGKTTVGLLTPRNVTNVQTTINYEPVPKVLRVRFLDRDNDYERDERLVFDDGYSASTPEVFADGLLVDMSRSGVTSADHAWEEGRIWLAHRRLRRETTNCTVGLEHMSLRRGDLVEFQHYHMAVGTQSARITGLVTNAGEVTRLQLDETVTLTGSYANYALQVRRRVSSATVVSEHTLGSSQPLGDVTELRINPNITEGEVAVGDLVAFGTVDIETRPMLVRSIVGSLYEANLELIDAAPAIWTADTGPIPDWDPGVTVTKQKLPAKPVIEDVTVRATSVEGHPDVLREVRMVVQIRAPRGSRPEPLYYEYAWREVGADDWEVRQTSGMDMRFGIRVQGNGKSYEIRVRAIGLLTYGRTAPTGWSAIKTVATPAADTTVSGIAKVRGLELSGQGHDTVFAGKNPSFSWRLSSSMKGVSIDELTGTPGSHVDPRFGYYEVVILNTTDGKRRRREKVQQPLYVYDFEQNEEDRKRLGESYPASSFRVEVTLVDKFKRRSNTAVLEVTNPAPAAPTVTITPGLNQIYVNIERPTDGDFVGMGVWSSDSSGFSPSSANLEFSVDATYGSFNADGGTERFIRVAAFDEFRDASDPDLLNMSSQLSTTPFATDVGALNPPLFNLMNMTITPDLENDWITWDAGQVLTTGANGTVTRYDIAAGHGPAYPGSGTQYMYFDPAQSETDFGFTTSVTESVGLSRHAIAMYRGGGKLWGAEGRKAFIATDVLLSGTVVAGLLTANEAVITGSAQIAEGIITQAKIETGYIDDAWITNLNGVKLDDDSIRTVAVRDDNIVRARTSFSASNFDLTSSWQEVRGRTDNVDGGAVLVIFSATLSITPQSVNRTVALRIRREKDSGTLEFPGVIDPFIEIPAFEAVASYPGPGGTIIGVPDEYFTVHATDRSPGSTERYYNVEMRCSGTGVSVKNRLLSTYNTKK